MRQKHSKTFPRVMGALEHAQISIGKLNLDKIKNCQKMIFKKDGITITIKI